MGPRQSRGGETAQDDTRCGRGISGTTAPRLIHSDFWFPASDFWLLIRPNSRGGVIEGIQGARVQGRKAHI